MSTLNNTSLITVNLTGFFHKGQHCLGIYYNCYSSLNGAIRKAGAVWTATHKCWWVPLNKASYEAVIIACESCAIVTRQALDAYLRSLATDTLKSPSPQQPETQNHLGEMSVYLRTLGANAADDMSVQRLKDYLAYCHTILKLSENTIHSRMNAIHPVGSK